MALLRAREREERERMRVAECGGRAGGGGSRGPADR